MTVVWLPVCSLQAWDIFGCPVRTEIAKAGGYTFEYSVVIGHQESCRDLGGCSYEVTVPLGSAE